MKSLTFSKSAFAVTAVLLATIVAACGGSTDSPAEETPVAEPASATTVPPAATAPAPPPPPAKKCAPSCKTDADCQNSCPELAGGVQCCDVKAGACFGSKTSACPKPETEPTDPPPAY